ncbi:family 20 glycosylhydrolase [Bulleidia sp. zg-1006]|uniref:family 20 glycosylhydrolase n=1 Tax=Bulleidia sp. zg-1006 TaxID=2806552 RepID=UPI001939CFF8|nr:family 20 glycosylhydrolase [Bulleidia sp. zg-1006]QRG87178.1 family 20 glycosylhydrolase [Bulleidia sp. zg-1006]
MTAMMVIGMASPLKVNAAPNQPDYSKKHKIISIDAGRKYFSADSIKNIITHAHKKGFTHLHLLLGNDGLRFTLNNIDLQIGSKKYTTDKINAAIKKGNKNYMISKNAGNIPDADNVLTETEMNDIIKHAKDNNITIIPGMNMPGHMDTIVTVMQEMGDLGEVRFAASKWGTKTFSKTTMDFENEKANDFLKAFLNKYLDYFQKQGIKDFNFGADEIGNDAVGTNEGGYGYVVNNNKYNKLVSLINDLAEKIINHDMQAYVFNDGMYYNDRTDAKIDPRINVFYWSSGGRSWGGPKYTSPSTIANKGHKIINTNERWYYVLGRELKESPHCGGAYHAFPAPNKDPNQASTEKMKSFKFDHVRNGNNDTTNISTIGSMICLWCDEPQMTYDESKLFKYMDIFVENNKNVFETKPSTPTPGTKMKRTMSVKDTMKVISIDSGRKYFTPTQIKDIITRASDKGYTHLQLILGNNGLRFALDNMEIKVNGKTYASDDIKSYITAGNKRYMSTKGASYTQNADKYLTESEMNDIINFAKQKKIEIIPLINTPGHMDAILTVLEKAGLTDVRYDCKDSSYDEKGNPSETTISMANDEALEFSKAFVKKYMDYFSSKGSKFFNIGADEYGNHDSNCQGFTDLMKLGLYGKFVNYLNELAKYSVDHNMRPMVFNDGIYYDHKDQYGQFDPNILIAYWTPGFKYNNKWPYSPAKTTYLKSKDHEILNTNDEWYYVLGSGQQQGTNGVWWYWLGMALDGMKKKKFDVNPGEKVDTVGSMICAWYDFPRLSYNTGDFNKWVDTFAELNPDVFKKSGTTPVPSEKDADYTGVDNEIAAYEKNHKPYKHLFTDKSIQRVENAIAKVKRGLKESEQSKVDAFAREIHDAIKALQYKPADFSKLDALSSKIMNANKNKDLYTEKSFAEFKKLYDAINEARNFTILDQERLDRLVEGLKKAIAGLEYKDADYKVVEDAKKAIPEKLEELYIPETVKAVKDAVAAVKQGLKITDQEQVNKFAEEIIKATKALKFKPANYDVVDKVINSIPKKLEAYTDASLKKLEEALNKVKARDLTIDKQEEVNKQAKEIEEAIAGLVKKDFDYAMLESTNPQLGQEARFKSEADFKKFEGVVIDGKLIDSSHYKAYAGSTVVVLSKEFTKTLKTGKHTIKILSVDGKATASFEVKAVEAAPRVPSIQPKTDSKNIGKKANKTNKKTDVKTGDEANLFGFGALGLLSILALVSLKKKYN